MHFLFRVIELNLNPVVMLSWSSQKFLSLCFWIAWIMHDVDPKNGWTCSCCCREPNSKEVDCPRWSGNSDVWSVSIVFFNWVALLLWLLFASCYVACTATWQLIIVTHKLTLQQKKLNNFENKKTHSYPPLQLIFHTIYVMFVANVIFIGLSPPSREPGFANLTIKFEFQCGYSYEYNYSICISARPDMSS